VALDGGETREYQASCRAVPGERLTPRSPSHAGVYRYRLTVDLCSRTWPGSATAWASCSPAASHGFAAAVDTRGASHRAEPSVRSNSASGT
jgi:hypothetical protein